ncbi:MAG TPA: long-chain-fatty-acid--CoA ligase [Blastocatellia bacterium]
MGGTIFDAFNESVTERSGKPAIICNGVRLTYRDLGGRVNRLAGALERLGIKPGDRVAILSLNCHRYLELYYGVPLMGAIVVPLNFRVPPAELNYIIEHSGARTLVVDAAFAPMLATLRDCSPSIEHYISIADKPADGCLSYEELLAEGEEGPRGTLPTEDDLVGLFYTSGTTGEPKGVMLTHKNIVSNVKHSMAVYKPSPDDIYLHAAPMFHLADAAAVFSDTTCGATHAFIPRFDPKGVLETVATERVTLLLLVPTMINFILRQPDVDQYDLSSLKQITYGASPIAPELLRKAMKVFKCRFFQGYGLTEAAPLLTVLRPEDHMLDSDGNNPRLASCGKPAPGVDVRVVKDDGAEVKPGETGEIIARGANIMAGYWKRPEDTAVAVRDGWLYTGDLATVDQDGYIYLVDRKKDMIVTGGENVFSTEVEAALYEHPAIKEAAVIAVPDPNWGEAVHACVALIDGQSAEADEIIEFCRFRLAGYKIPRSVEFFAGELPKGGTGKILKKELREAHWRGRTRRIS